MFATPTQLRKEQLIPISLEEAWDFFSRPKNLPLITPPYMQFNVLTDPRELEEMYAGQLIKYTVKPVMGIPLKWTTEITQVEHLRFFIDEQRFGPYKLWHHQHHFEEVDEGVLMTDIVNYMLPMGPLGLLARKLFVESQLEDIFEFRFKAVNDLFAKAEKVIA